MRMAGFSKIAENSDKISGMEGYASGRCQSDELLRGSLVGN